MIIILMGVTGSGKTTAGKLLSRELGWQYYDGDDFHPAANLEKMRHGVALDDIDRRPWLDALETMILDCLEREVEAVLACSALKESYRRRILIDERVKLVYLKGEFELIKERLSERRDHFMDPSLLVSQFATLEEPNEGLQIDISPSPDEIVKCIRKGLAR